MPVATRGLDSSVFDSEIRALIGTAEQTPSTQEMVWVTIASEEDGERDSLSDKEDGERDSLSDKEDGERDSLSDSEGVNVVAEGDTVATGAGSIAGVIEGDTVATGAGSIAGVIEGDTVATGAGSIAGVIEGDTVVTGAGSIAVRIDGDSSVIGIGSAGMHPVKGPQLVVAVVTLTIRIVGSGRGRGAPVSGGPAGGITVPAETSDAEGQYPSLSGSHRISVTVSVARGAK